MDKLDCTLLHTLSEQGRISFRELAAQVGMSSQTISDRVAKLVEKGVIKKFTIMVDNAQLQYPVTFVVELDVDLTKMEAVQKELAAYPELFSIHVITGDHDIIALGLARDIQNLYEIIEEKISNISGVKATKTSISLKTVKEVPKCIL